MVTKEFWSLHLPRKTYRDGIEYYGTFPEGFENKINQYIKQGDSILHLASGMSKLGQVRVDINPSSNANIICDVRQFTTSNIFDFCLIDCYYTPFDYDKVKQEYVSVYDFMKIGDKYLIPNGLMAVLHTLPPRKPKGYTLKNLIAISMGPDRQLRCLQIFKKFDETLSKVSKEAK